MNPKITELTPYRGFNIIRVETYSNWSKSVSYEAYRVIKGGVKDYIEDADTLEECKKKIRAFIQEEAYANT